MAQQMGRVLVIAGSDNSGGAGLEADQKVIAAHGCYAQTATTALTAQDTKGVYDIHHVPGAFLRKQIDLCFGDVGVDVVKTGMLASAETIRVVATALGEHAAAATTTTPRALVVDPVMVATSGAVLLPREAVHELLAGLLPQTTVLTPNVPEARMLLEAAGRAAVEVRDVEDFETVGRAVLELGPHWVLVKGGHAPLTKDYKVAGTEDEKSIVVDVLVGRGGVVERIESAYQRSTNTHGTGCSLASAIASNLAKGLDVPEAAKKACRYIEGAIRTAPGFGQGHGPLNHFHSNYSLPFAPGRFIDYLLGRPDVRDVWKTFVYHPFVMGLGNGTLPLASFKGYLVQDYLYLVHFARANALASYKATSMEDIVAGATIVKHIATEMALHIDYCAGFGISVPQIEATEEHQACTAYTRYVLDVGMSGDWIGLQVALAPCLLGYGAVAKQLHGDAASVRGEGNVYWKWIENYIAEDYQQALRTGSELLERHAARQSPEGIERLAKIFIHGTKVRVDSVTGALLVPYDDDDDADDLQMEIGFWEMFPCQ